MMGLPLLLSMDDASFTLLLLICTGLLYGNSLWGGYVWDDRAAIVTNLDVHGKTSLLDVFSHDFWGQVWLYVCMHAGSCYPPHYICFLASSRQLAVSSQVHC